MKIHFLPFRVLCPACGSAMDGNWKKEQAVWELVATCSYPGHDPIAYRVELPWTQGERVERASA